jgi:hypothetical protein
MPRALAELVAGHYNQQTDGVKTLRKTVAAVDTKLKALKTKLWVIKRKPAGKFQCFVVAGVKT